MAFCDFVIKYDPKKDSQEDITERILYSIIVKRQKAKKPTIIFIGGSSGEGKSLTALWLQLKLLKIQGLNIMDYIEQMNIFTPMEYAKKLDALLFDDDLKKINIICIHEARELIKAKLWYSFVNQAIADVNAMSRSIKRLCTIIISQFIRDIDTSIRYTLTYYCTVSRPKRGNARLYINVLWKDDRDLEKPKLRKRKLSGYLVYPNGVYRRFIPMYFDIKKIDKDIEDSFEKKDYEAKTTIIRKKLDGLIKEIQKEVGMESNKIRVMVDWYLQHDENLQFIGKPKRGKFIVHNNFKEMHELTDLEVKDFEKQINEKLKEKGMIEKEAGIDGQENGTVI